MKTISWLRTLSDLAAEHEWTTTNHMKVATGLSYMKCRRLLGGESPSFEDIQALAQATSMTAVDIVALHDINQEALDTESKGDRKDEQCNRQLHMFSETPAPVEESAIGPSGITDVPEPVS